jgi:iron complex transport system ATP-binding protein
MSTVLAASDVSFAYTRRGGNVIDAVSVSVSRSAILGVLGPNGSGKTTLLRLLSGALTPNHGSITFGNVPLASLSQRDRARRIAVVPQHTSSTFDFSALDIVLMGRYPHLGAFELEGPDDLAIALEAMIATGTSELADRAFSTLSGGEQQRVAIASALAQASEVLLLDEPTASLDLAYQLEIASLLAQLNRQRGTTMVVSTHDLNFAASLCTELVLIRQGRVLARGAVKPVLTPANIEALFGIEAEVTTHTRAGRTMVIPIGRRE